MLADLRERRPIQHRVALVVAHQDDETVGAGGSLYLMPDLLLVHVTDGAPRRLQDAAREGFATAQEYAAARWAELEAALALSGSDPVRVALGLPDQDASLHMPDIADRLTALFRTQAIESVLTHAYEGGHPDHDATALAVHLACAGRLPVFEFPLYHAASGGGLRTLAFLPGPPEVAISLSEPESARKRSMLACFHTQAAILSQFDANWEKYRAAPAYNFTAPPHPGPLNYENWGWEMTGTKWRRLAAAAVGTPCVA